MNKRLYDTALDEFVPKDVYELIEDDTKRIAQATKDWQDVKRGEFWYPNHAELRTQEPKNPPPSPHRKFG